MTLKQLCSQLASKPSSLDILLLFDKPYKILHPLCELLDNWGGYDEDQGEYQPVYEEFGSILLLLLAFVHRYSLTPTDLAIRSPDSFVGKLLGRGSLSRPLDELSDQEKSHLNGWVHGLFDSEAGGLGDDLMSSCPPQDFYLLMPTLFDQIVMALSTGCLNDYLLRSGLECEYKLSYHNYHGLVANCLLDLLDTLLLPSLVPALLFLANNLRTDKQAGQGAVIKILQLILRPNSISNEASTMLSSVLNIVAKPLELSLRSYQRQVPASQEVEPLLRALKENLAVSGRTGGADHSELENWTGTHHNGSGSVGGLYGAIRHAVQNLVQWAQHSPGNGVPTTYTHRQVLVALQICGARRLLSALLEELKAQTEAGNGPVAYDVVTAIICAPDVHNTPVMDDDPSTRGGGDSNNHPVLKRQRRITLREALKFEAEEFKKIQKSDPLMAETVVRLHRRVEAQMALPPPPPPPAQHHHHHQQTMLQPELSALGVVAGDAMGDSIMNAAAVAVSSGDHHHSVDAMSLDAAGMGGLDVGGAGGMDLSGMGDMGMGGMGGLTVNTSTGGVGGGVGAGAQSGGGAGGGAGAAGNGAGGAGGAGGGGSGSGGAGGDLSGDDIFSGLGTGDFTTDFGNWDTMDLG